MRDTGKFVCSSSASCSEMSKESHSAMSEFGIPQVCQSPIALFFPQLLDDISDVIVKSPADAVGYVLHSRQALTELWIHSSRLTA